MAATRRPTTIDFLLLDEAQDTNPVLEKVFTAQRGHAQLVMVGDSAQAIYGWRGARDVMSTFDATALTLSQSFRFGAAVATEAKGWLAIAGHRCASPAPPPSPAPSPPRRREDLDPGPVPLPPHAPAGQGPDDAGRA